MSALFIVIFAAIALLSRLVLHLPNLAALGGFSFAAGRLDGRRGAAWAIALAILSDLIIGTYHLPVMLTVWAAYGVMAWLGSASRRFQWKAAAAKPVLATVGLALLGSILFYLSTNYAVWAAAGWYPHTVSGLLSCYINAWPFFRNTLTSDVISSTVMIAAWEGAVAYRARYRRRLATVPAPR